MSIVNDRARIHLRRVTRHSWGPNPARVVTVFVIRDGDSLTAQCWGGATADGRTDVAVAEMTTPVLLAEAHDVTVLNRTAIELADGSTWGPMANPGCSCKVPAALRGFRPPL